MIVIGALLALALPAEPDLGIVCHMHVTNGDYPDFSTTYVLRERPRTWTLLSGAKADSPIERDLCRGDCALRRTWARTGDVVTLTNAPLPDLKGGVLTLTSRINLTTGAFTGQGYGFGASGVQLSAITGECHLQR